MIWHLVHRILLHFVSFAFFVTLLTWFSLALGCVLTFLIRKDHGFPRTFRGFLRFCFPAAIIKTQTCRADAVYYVVNRILTPVMIAPLLLGSAFCSATTYQLLTDMFGTHPQEPRSWLVWVAVSAAVTIGADFATFYTHYLDHKIPFLWEFHKVHHSSEFLIPITNKRFHPVQEIWDNAGVALTTGVMLGLFAYVLSMPIYQNTVVGIDTYFVVNALSFYHLRHSHIYMTYGKFEKFLLSPAQHHLHHSREDRHWDKNFGLLLSIWDVLFGTLLYSEPPHTYRLGLPNGEVDRFRSLSQLYFTPFVAVWKLAARRLGLGSLGLGHRNQGLAGDSQPGLERPPSMKAS